MNKGGKVHDSRLESLDLRSKVAMGALIATSICYVATKILMVVSLSGVMESSDGAILIMQGMVMVASGLGLIGCFLVAVIAWCMWAYRAYANLPEVFGIPIESSPGWAPGSFFIPFVNLFKPYQIMKEVWDKVAPSHEVGQHSWLSLWWACWIGQGVISRVTGEDMLETVGLGIYALLNGIEGVIYVCAAYGAVQVAYRITKFQCEYAGEGSARMADYFS